MGEKKREKAAEPRKRVASADAVSEREERQLVLRLKN